MWLLYLLFALAFLLAATALFFYVVTKGALLVRTLSSAPPTDVSHVYPIYTDMRLIKLVDFQPVISAILLFQYSKLVGKIVEGIRATNMRGKTLLVTSCAFGNVIPRVVEAAVDGEAERVVLIDIIDNELVHAKSKLPAAWTQVECSHADATAMHFGDAMADVNVMFFLLHELPHDAKLKALAEATRLLRPGGTLYVAEFHRPDSWFMRLLSWTYFTVFEPLGLALWSDDDPVKRLEEVGSFSFERTTFLGGCFQVVAATKR